MISARADISSGTRESVEDWGFFVRLVLSNGKSEVVVANGRKASQDISSDGIPIVNNNPYLSISVETLIDADLAVPDKGAKIKAPVDFFRPDPVEANWIWYSVDNVSKSDDDDWFVKIYLTSTEQSA